MNMSINTARCLAAAFAVLALGTLAASAAIGPAVGASALTFSSLAKSLAGPGVGPLALSFL